ncbi:MAG: RecX family transcriptional regulator [bacterium]|nr:RecX family transcriptional regulator [bacterium]
MIITKLEYQKNDPNRVSVYVDEKFAVGISQDDLLLLKLYKDKEITPEELNNIIAQSDFGKIFNFAVNFISFRPRSEWEVKMRLKRKDPASGGMTDLVIEKLKKLKLVDDEAFAKWFLEQRNTFRPKSDRVLKQELKIKGISDEIIKKVLTEDETSEFEKAFLIVNKKKLVDREKIIRFLGSRGFSWDIINDVIAKSGKTNYNDD